MPVHWPSRKGKVCANAGALAVTKEQACANAGALALMKRASFPNAGACHAGETEACRPKVCDIGSPVSFW